MRLDLDLARYLADLPAEGFLATLDGLSPADQRNALRHRFRYDIEGFCRYCWPDRFGLPFNGLHRDLFDTARERPAWDERTDIQRDAVAAPRGFAKSTISSFALPAHRAVYGLEAFIVIASAEGELALDLSRDLREAFVDIDSPLAELYGPFAIDGGVKGWSVSVRGAPSVAFLPRSERSAFRGRKHPKRGIRPTLIILDDAEDKIRVLNPVLRQRTWDWLTKDVAKAGRREGGTDIWIRGTVLHVDSMLARLLSGREHGWTQRRYKAIEAWPDERDGLWERCRAIWTDLSLGEHREAMARAFYEAHRDTMDRGAVVLGGLGNLYPLMTLIWAEGLAAFLQEMQNDPIDPSARVFEPEKWVRCRVDGDEVVNLATGRRVPLGFLRRTLWWDPAMGGATGDFAAIAVLGRDTDGYTYVLDVWCRREKPDAQLAMVWSLAERWGVHEAWYEDNGFQELAADPFERERDERRGSGRFWRLQLIGETSSEKKERVIATMQPDAANGWIVFGDRLDPEVDAQAAAFPTAAHDDALEAIVKGWRKLGGPPIRMEENPFARGGSS